MNPLSRLLGEKYNDPQLVSLARHAVDVDPMVTDASTVTIESTKGTVKLLGVVHRATERDRIEGVVRTTYQNAGLKFSDVVNELRVG